MRALTLLLGLTLLSPASRAATSNADPAPPELGFFETIPAELASPVTTPALPWLVGGVAATVAALVFRQEVQDPLQRTLSTRQPLGARGHFPTVVGDYGGQLVPNALYAGAMLTHGWLGASRVSVRRAGQMTKASIYAVGLTLGLKNTIREPRPDNPQERNAFPSGHSATAFAFSSYISAEHGFWPYGLPATLFAAFVGLSRINDNRHRLHQVLGGATLGAVYGMGVSYARSRGQPATANPEAPSARGPRWGFAPLFAEDGTAGLAAVLSI